MIECPKCHELVHHTRYQVVFVHEGCPEDAKRRAIVKRANVATRRFAVSYAKPFGRRH
jgi:hypothetical protein